MTGLLLAAAAALGTLAGPAAGVLPTADAGGGRQSGAFALIIGVNRSVDADATPLRFADDDAVRFRDLFRAAGVATETLTRPDDNTARLHPGAIAALSPPTLAQLDRAVDRLRTAVAAARAAGQATALYLIYAGHGKAVGGRGYITLEDAQLFGPDLLARIIDPVGAGTTHVVVDACQSYFAVLGRGPGGRRRSLRGFSRAVGAIAARPDIGLLLSTSSARESHEWAAFGAGVFSHEIRSGLLGAADADGDGRVSYPEIAAFVERANAAVPNEQFRPDVFARPPSAAGSDAVALLDLRAALARRIEVDTPAPGHHYLEDSLGVRWADFHQARAVRLVRPGSGKLYLRRNARTGEDDREYVLPETPEVIRLSALTGQVSRVTARGAAHDLFRGLFALPFGPDAVAAYESKPALDLEAAAAEAATAEADTTLATDAAAAPGPPRWPLVAATAAFAVGAAGGAWALLSGERLRDGIPAGASQREVADTNRKIQNRNQLGAALLGVGGAALLTGVGIWLWSDAPVAVGAAPGELRVGIRSSF